MIIRFAPTMNFAGKIYLDQGSWYWQPYKGVIQHIRPNGMLSYMSLRRKAADGTDETQEEEYRE